jgi:anthranilate phosphoribosyltransferase
MIQDLLKNLVLKQDLTQVEAEKAMRQIMAGEVTPSQTAGFLTALAMKGETVEEITGMTKIMREFSEKVYVEGPVLDVCGTGGSGLPRFNVSTTSAFILAAGSVKVAKHANRGAGGRCGSLDLLEGLGAQINLGPAQVETCIQETNLGVISAPLFHPAMKNVVPVRKELGIRTVFNILGPLTNPAGAQYQILGVSNAKIAPKMLEVLKNLGSQRVAIVHGEDGLDEITLTGKTSIWELNQGETHHYTIQPEDFDIPCSQFQDIAGGDVAQNVQISRGILSGAYGGPQRDLVLLNAAAGFLVYGTVQNFRDGIRLARDLLKSGKAQAKLEAYIEVSQSY